MSPLPAIKLAGTKNLFGTKARALGAFNTRFSYACFLKIFRHFHDLVKSFCRSRVAKSLYNFVVIATSGSLR